MAIAHQIKATKEVILSAGSIGSPQILQMSGIGPTNVLREAGIDTLHELPGVGENLHDPSGVRHPVRDESTCVIEPAHGTTWKISHRSTLVSLQVRTGCNQSF